MRSMAFGVLLALVLLGCSSKAPAPPETDVSQVQAAARKPAADGAMCGGYPAVQCGEIAIADLTRGMSLVRFGCPSGGG